MKIPGTVIFIILIFVNIVAVQAAPPSLPPLPPLEEEKSQEQSLKKTPLKKQSDNIPTENENAKKEEPGSFIDLGEHKLPSLTKEEAHNDVIPLGESKTQDNNTENKEINTDPIAPALPASQPSEAKAAEEKIIIDDKQEKQIEEQEIKSEANPNSTIKNKEALNKADNNKPAMQSQSIFLRIDESKTQDIISPINLLSYNNTELQALAVFSPDPFSIFIKNPSTTSTISFSSVLSPTPSSIDSASLEAFPAPSQPKQQQESLANKQLSANLGKKRTKELDANHLKFIDAEVKMLLLPNDEVVLGQLVEQARFDQMDMHSYIKLFKNNEEKLYNLAKSARIEQFIINCEENASSLNYDKPLIVEEAFEAVKKDNLLVLRALIDYYPILQSRNQEYFTLLHLAANLDRYSAAKLLIMRGINLYAINLDSNTALMIAQMQQNNKISDLLRMAGN